MTEDSAANATVKTVEYTEPSPVPESNWLWRRTYVFVVTALLCAHVGWLTYRIDDIGSLREIARNSQGLILLYALLYLAGASAEAISSIVAAIRTARKETVTSAPPPAQITTSPAGRTTVEAQPDAAQPKDGPPWRRT